MKMKDKRKRITIVAIILVISIVVGCIAEQIMPLLLLKYSIQDKGKCHLELECLVTENIEKYLPFLQYMRMDVQKITLLLDIDGDVYHGTVHLNDNDSVAMEFYKDKEDTVINVSKLVAYMANEHKEILPDKLVEIMDTKRDVYMTTDSIEELVGSSDVSVGDEILKLVEVHGIPSVGMISDNVFSERRNLPGLKFNSGDTATIKVHNSMGILNHGERTITGVRYNKGKHYDFRIKYRSNGNIKAEMPENSISRTEVIIMKKILKELAEKLAEKINERISD